MGICASGSSSDPDNKAKTHSKEIDKTMQAAQRVDQQVNKLLLLGAGESGKSTLFKQMIAIYGGGWKEDLRKEYVPIIYNNVITSVKTLCAKSGELTRGAESTDSAPKRAPIPGAAVRPKAAPSKKFIEELKDGEVIDSVVAEHMKILWADPGIQVTYEYRALYQLNDSTRYFLEKIHEIGAKDYLPTEQDVLRSRVRTTGIVESKFEIDGNIFLMIDVGGQRNERSKWVHCFEGVTAVIFVAALSEYDQVLFEDEKVNRMADALALFESICSNKFFKRTSMILFLNKRDLFLEKIQKVPLKVCFPEYTGDNTYDAASDYILKQFQLQNHNPERRIYPHITCATDKDNVKVVFNAVKDTVIRRSLEEGGLIT